MIHILENKIILRIYIFLIAFSLIFYLKGLSSSVFLQPTIYFTGFLILFTFAYFSKNSNIKYRLFFIAMIVIGMMFNLIIQHIFIHHINGFLNEFGRVVFPYIATFVAFFTIKKLQSNLIWKGLIKITIILLLIETIYRILVSGVYIPSFENRYLIKGGGIMFIDSNFTGYVAGVIYLLLPKFKGILNKVYIYRVILIFIILYSMSYSVFAGLFILLVIFFIQKFYILRIFGIIFLTIILYFLYDFISNDGSFLTKIEIINLAYEYVTSHNFFDLVIGIGHGNFAEYFDETSHGAHNFIGMSVEGGLIFLLINISVYYYFYKNKDNRRAIIFIVWTGIVSMYPMAYMSVVYVLLLFDKNKDFYQIKYRN